MKLSDLRLPEISSMDSLKFDNHGNNLYWCDRTRRTLDVLSLSTNSHTTIFKEVDGHIPFAVALVPDKRQVITDIIMQCLQCSNIIIIYSVCRITILTIVLCVYF